MARRDDRIEHLLRRAGFGGSPNEVAEFAQIGYQAAVDLLVFFEQAPDDIDLRIGVPGHVGVTTRGQFSPDTSITDARQRWLFRMVHTRRPLQEKMALFWHHHFATAYSKISDTYGGTVATRMMAAKPSEDGPRRSWRPDRPAPSPFALGNFHDLLVAIAKDVAMLVWLDGRLQHPPAAAGELRARADGAVHEGVRRRLSSPRRTCTPAHGCSRAGTSGRQPRSATMRTTRLQLQRESARHHEHEDVQLPDLSGRRHDDPRRRALQEGLDLINACAAHPETGRFLARKLYTFFVTNCRRRPPTPSIGSRGVPTTAADTTCGGCARHPPVAGVQRSGPVLGAVRLAGRVRRAGRSRKSGGWGTR